MQVARSNVGIDVAKAELVIHFQGQTFTIENTPKAIKRWLKSLPCPCEIAIEATGTYHMAVIELAHAKGHHIYVIDASRLSSYRKGTGGRAREQAAELKQTPLTPSCLPAICRERRRICAVGARRPRRIEHCRHCYAAARR